MLKQPHDVDLNRDTAGHADQKRIYRILAIDDEPHVLLMLKSLLQLENYLVETASSGEEALKILPEVLPDLILLDVSMPGMDGFTVCRKLKEDSQFEHIPLVFLTGRADLRTRVEGLRLGADDFINKPFDVPEVTARVRNLLRMKDYQDQLRQEKENLEMRVQERTSELQKVVTNLQETQNRLEVAHYDTLVRLSVAAEYRDNETGNHIKRMSNYSELLARKLGLDDQEVRMIKQASPMHDVGKLGIPDAILLKPGRLTAEEFQIMQQHTDIGGKILDNSTSPLLEYARIIAVSHHEHMNGSGYPNGLQGDDIPVSGRIVAVADVFDALSSVRVYKPAFPLEKTLTILKESAGSHLDADMVKVFIDSIDEVLEIAGRYSDSDNIPTQDRWSQ